MKYFGIYILFSLGSFNVTAAVKYYIEDLGTLGGNYINARGINNLGQVVGESSNGHGRIEAFVYSEGEMKGLGSLGGGDSYARDINDSGVIVGSSPSSFFGQNGNRAFIYSDGQMKNLGRPLNTSGSSTATAINNSGIIGGSLLSQATIFHEDYQDIIAPATSLIEDVNNNGMAVGAVRNGKFQASIFYQGQIIPLKTTGIGQSLAYGVNDSGVIVGSSENFGGRRTAFYYEEGEMYGIKGLENISSIAWDINNKGTIVGESIDLSAFVFDIGEGEALALFDLLVEKGDWTGLNYAYAINDKGQIVGTGRLRTGAFSSVSRAFLLTPVPIPGAVLLFFSSVLGLMGYRKIHLLH